MRVSRAASEVPEQIEARLSASVEAWNGEQVPCSPRGVPRDTETRTLAATIVKELGALAPLDLLITHLSPFALGVLASLVFENIPRRRTLKP